MEYFFFPKARKNLFTNRVSMLKKLNLALDELQAARPGPVALIGRRRVGKTELLRYWVATLKRKGVFPIWVDLQEGGSAPIALVRYWYGCAAYWFLEKDRGSPTRYLSYMDLDTALRMAVEAGNRPLSETGLAIQRELAKEKPDERLLLSMVFDLGENLAQDSGMCCLLIIDEFQDLNLLSNFKQISNIFALFRSRIQVQQRTLYVAAGSAVRLMEDIFSSGDSPLFGQFRTEYVGHLGRQDSSRLAVKLCPELSPLDLADLYRLTGGHPYYIHQVARRCRELLSIHGPQEDLVTRAFVMEVSFAAGAIYQHCRYVLETSLKRARGYAMLKNIMLALASEGALTLSALARRLKRKAGEARTYLQNLMAVDLVSKTENNRFTISDPVLSYWLRNERLGLMDAGEASARVLEELLADLQERFSQVAAELGRAKEFELYYFVESHQGKQVGGCWIPRFRRIIKNYLLPNGDEIDLFAANDETWAFELKWKGRRVGRKELESFLKKIQTDHYVVVSASGFTAEAQQFAGKHGIHLWDRDELSRVKPNPNYS
ncbi:MAG: restriction endonuclease [Thermodesulfobacteriota bacterium]|nr:restriction endonuclease [Thermodesulfobacteriota bacterium]